MARADRVRPSAKLIGASSMSDNGRHWIAAGSQGVVVDGQVLHLNTYKEDRTGVAVAPSGDGAHWVAAGAEGVVVDGKLIETDGVRLHLNNVYPGRNRRQCLHLRRRLNLGCRWIARNCLQRKMGLAQAHS